MYLDGAWHGLAWQPAADADPISQLDVTGLQDRLLAPILGLDDPRTSKRVDFIGGIRGAAELVKAVDSGMSAVAFSMYPTTVEQLMAIADANQIMPPKSTWFEPKLRSGLICFHPHLLSWIAGAVATKDPGWNAFRHRVQPGCEDRPWKTALGQPFASRATCRSCA